MTTSQEQLAPKHLRTKQDDGTTRWEEMVHSLPPVLDHAYFRAMKPLEKVPVLYCINNHNITVMSSFVPAVLKKIGHRWEILDEHEAKLLDEID